MRVFLGLGGLIAGLASVSLASPVAQTPVLTAPKKAEIVMIADKDGLTRWLTGFRFRAEAAGISSAVLDAALSNLDYDADVIRRDQNQSEFTKTIWDYLDTAVSDSRIANGQAALRAHADLLQKIETRYGVDKEIVAAVWGLESAYGTFRGSVPTIQALATLAYDGRRGAFFESELLNALKILQAGDTQPEHMQGSWAGAMGHTQFMPSSFLAYAQDFDGDGKRNIWGDDPSDALASAAAYLAHFGWAKSVPWGLEIRLPKDFDYELSGERIQNTVAEWQAMGVQTAEGQALPDHGLASVLLPGGAGGAAFLIFANFQVIERYNTADAYVIAIGHLADRLKGGPPIRAEWPRQDRALKFDERIEMQQLLTTAGFDTLGVDGKIGPNTIAAVRAFQKHVGWVPDGYPSLRILEKLRF